MKKAPLIALLALLAGLTPAEAKKEKNSGKNKNQAPAISEAKSTGKAHQHPESKKLKNAEKKGPQKSTEAKGTGKEKSASAQRDSDEMKAAVAQKKAAQKAAKESGEKIDKKKKSSWKFWKK